LDLPLPLIRKRLGDEQVEFTVTANSHRDRILRIDAVKAPYVSLIRIFGEVDTPVRSNVSACCLVGQTESHGWLSLHSTDTDIDPDFPSMIWRAAQMS
jgi:hypothetical protein